MYDLVINRIKFKLDSIPFINVSSKGNLLFKKKSHLFKTKLKDQALVQYQDWCNKKGISDNDLISFDFQKSASIEDLYFEAGNYFSSHYIKFTLLNYFEENGFLIEENPRVFDFCIYEKIGEFNLDWEIFRRYDFTIKNKVRELVFNISSNKTLISNKPIPTESRNIRGVSSSGKISPISKFLTQPNRIVANKQLRDNLEISNIPKPVSYKEIFGLLDSFYKSHILKVIDDHLFFTSHGLNNVNSQDIREVNPQDNKMLFKNSHKDINSYTGMRDYGAYKPSPKALEIKFIFIYENRDDANKFYQYLKSGLRHFPGLERYVGIPVTLEKDFSLKYSDIKSLKVEFNEFLQTKLIHETYDNFFAMIIGPFKKNDSDEKESDLYYYIKENLLRKGISSQFVSYKSIRDESSFHFYLPNISIAILAKLGGIPWRLDNKSYKELIVGFNQVRLGEKTFIGSAVFFNNEGYLNSVNAFPQTSSTKVLVDQLREAINKYLVENNEYPKRLVIHYYKPQNYEEKEQLENLLLKELNLDIPYAIIEINDGKSHSDICFDKDNDMGMPKSGIYIRTGPDEFLIFNNTRYEKKPLRTVIEELPIKVKIQYADEREFLTSELIGQIYEFSCLYWKSLKQKSVPVTTLYAKLIADYSSHFKEKLPKSDIVKNSPWFL